MRLFGLNITQARETSSDSSSSSSTSTTTTTTTSGTNICGTISYANTPSSAMTVAAVYRAIALRADTMAQLTMKYQRLDPRGNNYTDDLGPTRGQRLNYLVQVQPNDRMNWVTLMRQAEARRVLFGNGYVYVEKGMDEEVSDLWLCQGATYNAIRNTYDITYYVGNQVTSKLSVPANQIIHLRNTYTYDGFTGISTLAYANRVFNTAATQDQLTLDTAAKGGKKKLVIQENKEQTMGLGKVAKEQMKKIANQFAEDFFDNDVTYVPNAANISDYSQSMAELEILASRKYSVEEIGRFFGVPNIMLGDASNSSYKTPESATNEFLTRTIMPLIKEWENEFNSKVLTYGDFGKHRFHLCEENLFRLDRSSQAVWEKHLLECGIKSVNELRADHELPRIEGGDDHYLSTNLAVAGSEKLKGGNTL